MIPRVPSSRLTGKLVVINRREAMLGQGKVKVESFPVGNRAARRLKKSKKAKERPL